MLNSVVRSLVVNAGLAASLLFHASAHAVSPNVIISEIFPRGTRQNGTPNASDWIELYNQSSEPVDMSNWSLQYAAAVTSSFQSSNVVALGGGSIIPANGFFLIELGESGITSTDQPVPDKTFNRFVLHNDGARLALVSNSTAIGTNYTSPNVVDLVGYNSLAITYEGTAPAPPLPADQLDKSIQRIRNYVSPTDYTMWRDHDDNGSDFIIEYKTRSNSDTTTRTHVPVSLSGFSVE